MIHVFRILLVSEYMTSYYWIKCLAAVMYINLTRFFFFKNYIKNHSAHDTWIFYDLLGLCIFHLGHLSLHKMRGRNCVLKFKKLLSNALWKVYNLTLTVIFHKIKYFLNVFFSLPLYPNSSSPYRNEILKFRVCVLHNGAYTKKITIIMP